MSSSSLVASNPPPLSRFPSRAPATIRFLSSSSLPNFDARSKKKSASVRASRTIGSPEPPWLVLPPAPLENPFSADERPSEIQMRGICGGNGIPFSLRLVQMKKRLAATERFAPAVGASPTGKAVSAVLFMIGELQKAVFPVDGGAEEDVFDRVSRVRRETFLWLFRRVFFSSPNLLGPLLVLLADFVAFSTEKNTTATATGGGAEKSNIPAAVPTATVQEEIKLGIVAESAVVETIRIGDHQNWFDVGIKEGYWNRRQQEGETPVDRRRRAYERAIAEGEINSLILSNYAQFLYLVASDHDRAEQYFRWAVLAEPRDAEAMSRYGFFLWKERDDIAGAEEMFLEAIEAEPGSHHHGGNYASFLWETGAGDTCFLLDDPHPSLSRSS